jgi:hypothetical protein
MKRQTIPVEGAFNQRFVTLEVYAELVYEENDYLDIETLNVWSERRKAYVPASDRLALAFQESHWDILAEKCEDYHRAAWEAKRDEIDYIGDMKCHERREREAAA